MVRFRDDRIVADDFPRPPGNWKLISHNDRGLQNWWALAVDPDSRGWAASHPGDVISGCVDARSIDLAPINGIRA